MATVLPGLEPVARSEISVKIEDASIAEIARGKVFFTTRRPLEQLLTLRTIDNLYRFIRKLRIGPHRVHLSEAETELARTDLSGVLDDEWISRPSVTFAVNASRSGKHTYSRFELAEAAARGLSRLHPHWKHGTPERRDLEFRLDLNDDLGLFSLKLTPASFRFRGDAREFSRAALRPTVAHALVWLTDPKASDRFLDPFCGSGTILAERAVYPSVAILGGDIEPEAIAAARRNVPRMPGLSVQQWDARKLPIDAGAIDKIATNLPFGQQILSPEEISGLYLACMKEMRRVLAEDGQALLLTDQAAALNRAADRMNLRLEPLFQLSLKGLHPCIFRAALT
jgi:23S rRNA G2445 N2-methylase RlmL